MGLVQVVTAGLARAVARRWRSVRSGGTGAEMVERREQVREAGPEAEGINEVRLVGRVSGTPETRSLPSGDEVVQLRVVVRRPPDPPRKAARARGAGRPEVLEAVVKGARASVDTIDVSCWTALTRRAGLRMADGDVVEVEGSLRRRFYRAGPSVQSRYDVVAERVRRASTRGGAGAT